MKLDKFDREILRVLQQNATISMADLSQQVGLSHTPCWRRVKRLEAEGIILRKVTLLNGKKLNLGVSVFIYVSLKNHDGDSLTDFENAVQSIEEIVELESHSDFDVKNPNRARSIYGAFGMLNLRNFHHESGSGYEFLGRAVESPDIVYV